MSNQDGEQDLFSLWRTRLSLVAGGVAVLGACLAARYYWGPESASAQAPAPVYTPSDLPRGTAAPPQAAQVSAPAAPAAPKTLTLMAMVNGEQITRQELAQACLERYGREVLETIINKHLIIQACTQKGIQVTPQELNDEVTRMATRFGLSPERWLTLLETERHISPEQYKHDIIWPTIALRRLAADRMAVTKEDLEKAWEAEYGPKVKVRIISQTNEAKAHEAREKALAKPDDFAQIAKQYSEDPTSASIGGLIPPVRKHVGDPAIEKVVFAMKDNEISQVVKVGPQFFVIKCEKRVPSIEVKAEHQREITERLSEQIRENKLRTAATDVFKQLQDTAKVVNVLNDERLKAQMPGVAATINGQSITIAMLAEECLARHGAEVIEGEVNRKLLSQALRRKNQNLSFNDQRIMAEIDRAAVAYGMVKADKTADREKWLDKVVKESGGTVDLYIRDVVWPSVALKLLVSEKVQISEADLQKAFVSNYGERVEVLVCVLSDQKSATHVFDLARQSPTKQFFQQICTQYSVEPISRANAGEVPPIRLNGGQPLIEREAFKLKAGELSDIIVTGDKYVLMYCLGRTKPVVASIDDVRDQLTSELHESKFREVMSKTFEHIRTTAQIDNYLLGTVQSGKSALDKGPVARTSLATPVPGAPGTASPSARGTVVPGAGPRK